MPINTAASTRREGLAQWWQLRSRGERRLLLAGAALVVLSLLWLLVWQPLLLDTERSSRELALDRVTVAEARREADAIAGLAQSAPPVAAGDARAAVDAVLVQQGLKSAASSIEASDHERLRLTFDSIAFDALSGFLDALQKSAQLRAVELVVTARTEPGRVRADLTVAR